MKPQFISLLGILCAVVLSGAVVPPVQAANLNVTMTDCKALPPSPTSQPVIFSAGGVSTGADMPRFSVVCPVPRSPLAAGQSVGGFYVDGGGLRWFESLSCTLSSYNYTGGYLGSASFTVSGANSNTFDQYVSLPLEQLPTWAYTVLVCDLPADGGGSVSGVTAIQ